MLLPIIIHQVVQRNKELFHILQNAEGESSFVLRMVLVLLAHLQNEFCLNAPVLIEI